MKNWKLILIVIVNFVVVYLMFKGNLQLVINFNNEISEMAFTAFSIFCGIFSLIGIDYKKLANGLN